MRLLKWLFGETEQISGQDNAVPAKKPMRIGVDAVIKMAERTKARKIKTLMYKPYEPAAGVLPLGKSGASIAMDANFAYDNVQSLALFADINGAIAEGYAWPGFNVLANWTQISEFRKPAEIYAREMTRKWIQFRAVGDADKTDRIKQVEAEFKRLNVQSIFRQAIELDGHFGRAQIFFDVGDKDDDAELRTPLNESPEKIPQGSLKRLKVIEPMWSYPNRYNADNPISENFYRPTSWFVMGKEIDSTRLCTIVTRELPDILKPAYAFSGLSLSQMLKPYVDNWLRTRQSVSDLIHSFTVWVLKTNMSNVLNDGGAQSLFDRLQIFNLARDNHGAFVVDKNDEEFENVSATLGGLDHLLAQSQEQMCAPAGTPLVFLTGITPSGLNASNDSEIKIFKDVCASMQEILTPHISKILNIVMLSLWGEKDPDIGFIWEPLYTMSEAELATSRKVKAETDAIYIEQGVIDSAEVRKKVANQEDSPYSGLDLDAEISPPANPADDPEMIEHFHKFGE